MTEYFIVFDKATGDERWRGQGLAGAAASQVLPEGLAVISIPQAVWSGPLDAALNDIRLCLWDQVKTKRDAVINGGAPTPSGAVDSDELSRSNISGAVLAALIAKTAGAPFSMNWTMLDNSVATLDADAVIALGLAVMQHVNLAHDRARALRAEIESTDAASDLLRIDLAEGWPS
jgi:hypothetical protein